MRTPAWEIVSSPIYDNGKGGAVQGFAPGPRRLLRDRRPSRRPRSLAARASLRGSRPRPHAQPTLTPTPRPWAQPGP